MNERSSRGPGRRVGRERVLEAAAELLEVADLADLLSFLGIRAVADAADVQPSTVHHHFANRQADAKPNARLAAAVLQACLADDISGTTTAEAEAVTSREASLTGLAALRLLAQDNLEHFLTQRRMAVGTFVGAAVAANDPVARSILFEQYESLLASFAPVFEAVAEQLGRRFDVEHGFTAEALSVVATALVDGFSLRHQFDPDRVRPELFGEVVFRLFEAATLPADTEAAEDAVVERLLSTRTTLDLPAGSQLDQGKRTRIVEAARRRYETGGTEALTVTAVARDAGVGRSTVISHVGGRSGLAGAVWAQHVPALERRLEADRARSMPLERIAERHLQRVVELCRETRELSSLLLEGMTAETVRSGSVPTTRPDDPRTAVPLPMLLVPVLLDAADELRPGVADTPQRATDLALLITYLTMVRGVNRPEEPSSETVQYIMDLFFEGVLDRSGS